MARRRTWIACGQVLYSLGVSRFIAALMGVAALGAAAIGAGCGAERIVGTEPWSAPPELRIAVVILDDGPQVFTLDGRAPIITSVPDSESAELWLFSYRVETLKAAFPGLQDDTVETLLTRVVPVIGGTTGEVPPPADEILNAPLGADAPNPIAYAKRTWSDWGTRSANGLGFRLELPPDAVCGQTTLSTVTVPANIEVQGVVAIGGERALVTGALRSGADRSVQLFLLERGRLTPLAARTEPTPTSRRPSWDPTTGTAWDIDDRGQIFRYGLTGDSQPVPPMFDDPDINKFARDLSVGRDGTVLATFDVFITEQGVRRFTQSLFRLDGNQWSFARVRDGAFGIMDVVRADRFIAYYRCWVYQYRDPNDASGWKQSVLDARCPTSNMRDVRSIDLDDEGGVVTGKNGFMYLRDEARGEWVESSAGLPRAQDYALGLAMGGGQALVASEQGGLYFRRSGRWCPVETALTFDRGSSAPEGRVAYLVPEAGDQIVRVEIP